MTSKMGEIFPAFRRYSTGLSAVFHRLFGDIPPASRRSSTAFTAICRCFSGDMPAGRLQKGCLAAMIHLREGSVRNISARC